MTLSLERRLRFVERRAERSPAMPWLKQKALLVELWTAAYMLDRWEAWVMLLVPLALAAGAVMYFFRQA